MRIFNTAGPVNRALHYCLDPLHRPDLENLLKVADLEPISVTSLEGVIDAFAAHDESLTYRRLRLAVLKK